MGLAWWGQDIRNGAAADGIGADDAALAANELWQLMVEDVTWVLKEILTKDRVAVEQWLAEKAAEDAEEAAEQREREEDTEARDAAEKEGEDGEAVRKKTLAKPAKKPTKVSKGQPATASKKRSVIPFILPFIQSPAKVSACSKRGEDGEGLVAKKTDIGQAAQPKARPKPRPLTRG